MVGEIAIEQIVWDPSIYPRSKWSSSTVERYAEALEAGARFPPVVLEAGTNRLLDGKHRLEAYKLAGRTTILAEWHKVPEGMSPKYYAATLSAAHGDRLSYADLKALAEEEFQRNPSLSAAEWGRRLGVPERTVRRWVSHIIQAWRNSRQMQAWHLYRLGWTQREIGEKLGVTQSVISEIIGNGKIADFDKVLPPDWNDRLLAQEAERLGLPLVDAWALALEGLSDEERLSRLGIRLQPYDVWLFGDCHELMGRDHPGRIPGQLVCHVLYFFTQPGDLVVDPMAGGGTTVDACLLMGRRCRAYDIDLRHNRMDIEYHDLSHGWPATVKKASLVFWDPPYFRKRDGDYIEGSISGLDREGYLAWLGKALADLHRLARPGTRLAFLMGDWTDDERPETGIFVWDYARLLQEAGWRLIRQIQCPLSSQQVHPDIVKRFRQERRLARLCRYLLVGVRV